MPLNNATQYTTLQYNAMQYTNVMQSDKCSSTVLCSQAVFAQREDFQTFHQPAANIQSLIHTRCHDIAADYFEHNLTNTGYWEKMVTMTMLGKSSAAAASTHNEGN